MGVLDRARAHFENRAVHTIEVPEWGEGDKPLVVHFKSPTLADLSRVQKESKGDTIEQAARLVAMRAQDADGNRLMQPAQYGDLMRHADPAIVTRIANAIMNEAKLDPAGAEKNSGPILSD